MFSEQWTRVVTASVAPVVVISASGLLCLAFYNRLAAIVSRLRTVQRERLTEQIALRSALTAGDSTAVRRHRRLLHNLKLQTDRIIQRARMIRLTLLCLLGTVALLVLSSILNGLTLVWPATAFGAAVLFVGGMVSLLIGVVAAMMELRASLDVVEIESRLVSELTETGVGGETGDENDQEVASPDGVDASERD